VLYQLSYLGVNPIVSAPPIGGNRRQLQTRAAAIGVRQLSWWGEFVDGCAKAESYMPVPVISAARTEAWIEKQAAPSLAAVFANKGGDMDYLQELLTEGRKRWGEKHRLIADGLV
jgi:hypothetical protein